MTETTRSPSSSQTDKQINRFQHELVSLALKRCVYNRPQGGHSGRYAVQGQHWFRKVRKKRHYEWLVIVSSAQGHVEKRARTSYHQQSLSPRMDQNNHPASWLLTSWIRYWCKRCQHQHHLDRRLLVYTVNPVTPDKNGSGTTGFVRLTSESTRAARSC